MLGNIHKQAISFSKRRFALGEAMPKREASGERVGCTLVPKAISFAGAQSDRYYFVLLFYNRKGVRLYIKSGKVSIGCFLSLVGVPCLFRYHSREHWV